MDRRSTPGSFPGKSEEVTKLPDWLAAPYLGVAWRVLSWCLHHGGCSAGLLHMATHIVSRVVKQPFLVAEAAETSVSIHAPDKPHRPLAKYK